MERLVLIDANNFFHRSYHALSDTGLSSPTGEPTWAVHGLITTISAVVRELQPSHCVVAFDEGQSRYRLSILPSYKEGRKKSPGHVSHSEHFGQMQTSKRLLTLMGFMIHGENGVEADDVIATLVRRYQGEFEEIIMVSGDKDLRQLVRSNVRLYSPPLGKHPEQWWDVDAVRGRYGLDPERLPELWALTGDPGDGVKGVPGIGEKTAQKLLDEHGSLSFVLISGDKKIVGHDQEVMDSYHLIHLDGSLATCAFGVEQMRWSPTMKTDPKAHALVTELRALGMQQLLDRWVSGLMWQKTVRRRRLAV
jgi:DNA polymerase-1